MRGCGCRAGCVQGCSHNHWIFSSPVSHIHSYKPFHFLEATSKSEAGSWCKGYFYPSSVFLLWDPRREEANWLKVCQLGAKHKARLLSPDTLCRRSYLLLRAEKEAEAEKVEGPSHQGQRCTQSQNTLFLLCQPLLLLQGKRREREVQVLTFAKSGFYNNGCIHTSQCFRRYEDIK